jgi:hypothetical protein
MYEENFFSLQALENVENSEGVFSVYPTKGIGRYVCKHFCSQEVSVTTFVIRSQFS